jgi:hypothetical protein
VAGHLGCPSPCCVLGVCVCVPPQRGTPRHDTLLSGGWLPPLRPSVWLDASTLSSGSFFFTAYVVYMLMVSVCARKVNLHYAHAADAVQYKEIGTASNNAWKLGHRL